MHYLKPALRADAIAGDPGRTTEGAALMSDRRRISEVIIVGYTEGRGDDPEWNRARLWADSAPRLFDACSAAYIAYQRRKMDPGALKEAMAFCEEITSKIAHEVWLGGPWALRTTHESAHQANLAKESAAG